MFGWFLVNQRFRLGFKKMSTVRCHHFADFSIDQGCQLLEKSGSDISEVLLRFQPTVRRFDWETTVNVAKTICD